MTDPLIEPWQISARINLYLLQAVSAPAHIHNVRLMWLKASAPDLLAGLEKSLDASAAAMHAFVGCLVSHESHHRGQMALALEQSRHPVDKKARRPAAS